MNLKRQFKEWIEEARKQGTSDFVKIRKFYKLSQEEMAVATGQHINTITNIETGQTSPKLGSLYAYARAAEEYAITQGVTEFITGRTALSSFSEFESWWYSYKSKAK